MKKSDFNKLKAKWYAKLAKSGFEDIEQDENHLKYSTITAVRSAIRYGGSIEGRKQYYDLAINFLNDYEFKSHFERIVWEYHANGMSGRDIAATLNKVRRKKTDRTTVRELVVELRTIMKKMYGITK